MRVLHVLPSLSSTFGGPSAALLGLSRALSARGVRSEIVTTDLGLEDASALEFGRLIEERGVSARYFPRVFSSWLPRDFAFSPQLAQWLRANIRDYDVVHLHGLFNYPNTVAARIAARANVPYILRPCGMLDPWCLRQSRIKKRAYLKLFDERTLLRAAAVSFTTQEEARVSYKVKGQAHGVVIPLGVNMDEEGSFPADELTFPENIKIILFLSRLDPKKGLDLLLPALARLKTIRDDFFVVIAGNGRTAYETQIKQDIEAQGLEDIVKLVGFVEGSRKIGLLKQAACFVLPSYQENFGVSVAEAMSVGCPVVISDQVNIHEEVSAAQAGRVVPCDAGQLFVALNELLDDKASRHKMGRNGQALVEEQYSWARISKMVISLYEQCLS